MPDPWFAVVLYGEEHLTIIWIHVETVWACKNQLKALGIPTVNENRDIDQIKQGKIFNILLFCTFKKIVGCLRIGNVFSISSYPL